jgi:hypothetical protein
MQLWRVFLLGVAFTAQLPPVAVGQSATNTITGVVRDARSKQVLPGVVLMLARHPKCNQVTDSAGRFACTLQAFPDTVTFSSVGYKTFRLVVPKPGTVQISLSEDLQLLRALTVSARPAVSESFAVNKLQKLDVYTNPMAAGDPLKAITILPSSTPTDDSAEPALRGSGRQ